MSQFVFIVFVVRHSSTVSSTSVTLMSWSMSIMRYVLSLMSYLVLPSHDNSGLSWTVSIPVKGTAAPIEKLGVLQTLICAPVVRPKRCPTSSNPALLRSWTVVCPSFTLLMMLLLLGWPTMGLNRIRKKKNNKNYDVFCVSWALQLCNMFGNTALSDMCCV